MKYFRTVEGFYGDVEQENKIAMLQKQYHVLFHSTDSEHFTVSDPSRAAKGEQFFNPLGDGIYFSTNKEFSRTFGRNQYYYLLPKTANIKAVTPKKWENEFFGIMKACLRKGKVAFSDIKDYETKLHLCNLKFEPAIHALNELQIYMTEDFQVEDAQRIICDIMTTKNAKYDAVWYRTTDFYVHADEIVVPHHKFNPEYFLKTL